MQSILHGLKVNTFIRTAYDRRDLQENPGLINQHWHNFYQLVYVRRGSGAMVINGIFYPIGENDVIIVRPNEPHDFSTVSEKMETYEIKYILLDGFPDILKDAPRYAAGDTDGSIKRALKQMEAESDSLGPYSKEIIALELCKILLLIRRNLSRMESAETAPRIRDEGEPGDALFARVTAYIDSNIDRQFTVRDISDYFYTEYTYFSRLFSAKYGIRLKQYINHKRLTLAKELITGTNLSLTEISQRCGFENLHRMERSFKKEEGISPSEFRRCFKVQRAVAFDQNPKTFYQFGEPNQEDYYEQC